MSLHVSLRAPVVWMSSGGRTGGEKGRRERAAGDAVDLSGVRVLIVEDDALVALDMETILLQAGCDVVSVVDSEHAAVDTAQRLQPDIILMDIALRKGDGISAARSIRRRMDLAVVYVSGNTDQATVARAATTRPAGFVRKPFDGPQLLAALRSALSKRP